MSDLNEAFQSSVPLTDSDYRMMVNAIGDYAVFLLDAGGYIRSWNLGAQRLKGYAPEEIIGRHFSTFYPQEALDRNWPERELIAAREIGRLEDEGWRLRKDGTRFWANVVITRLLNDDGSVRGFVKVTRDLTERRQQENLLRLSEERFRLLVDGVRDYAIFMLDPDGHIASWNAGAQKNKGYTAAEIIGKHFSIFYPPEVAASGWPEQELQRALEEGRCEDEGWRVRKDGTRFWASVIITALFDETGTHRGFSKITRDLTDKRRIRALEDEGRRITTFLAMLGHELRNPLAPIANALFIMQREDDLTPRLQGVRDILSRQLRQVTHLVDDLLDVGRITSGKIHLDLQPLRLRDVIHDAIEGAEPLMRRKAHLVEVDTDGIDSWVRGDRTRLVQVLGNLLSNAAKFTQPNGHIVLTLREQEGHAELSVRDNGPGIAPALLPNVFDLFVQGEPDTARSQGGLGLSLVQQLVALHGGDVSALSSGREGDGTEFLVRLPLASSREPDEPAGKRAHRTEGKGRILIVDDNRDSADTMRLLLQTLGYEADVVYDGPAALQRIHESEPDLALMDIGLPGMSGLDIARRVAAGPQRPRMIAITGYGLDSDRQASREAGFDAHLTKPVDADVLIPLIERLLHGDPAPG